MASEQSNAESNPKAGDPATQIQEALDQLALAAFNALLEVSRASLQHDADQQAQQLATAFTRNVQEVRRLIPQLLPPEDAASERETLRALQAEYGLMHKRVSGVVEEAGLLSSALRQTLSSVHDGLRQRRPTAPNSSSSS